MMIQTKPLMYLKILQGRGGELEQVGSVQTIA